MKTFIDVYHDSFKLDKPVGSKKYSKKQIKNGSEKKKKMEVKRKKHQKNLEDFLDQLIILNIHCL